MAPYYFELIITDICMPKINGIKLYFKFKAINPQIKILFLSALDAVEDLISVLSDKKSSDVVRKPIQLKYLLSKIKTVLSQD
jgi:DNA-binding response OmpR family regulator